MKSVAITRIVLIADEGKVLTNGETYAKSITLGDWDSANNYHEITTEEYAKIMAERETESEEIAT